MSDHTKLATYQEITTQPDTWQEALRVTTGQAGALQKLWTAGNYDQVMFTGCGSTYYLSLAAAALFQELTGRPARGAPGGELALYPAVHYPAGGRALLVAVSRSGETTETLQAVKQFRQNKQGEVVTVTNYGHSPLVSLGDVNLVIEAGQEESLAQTRSVASMYLATTAIAALLAGRPDLGREMDRLPEAGRQLIGRYEGLAQAQGSNLNLDRFYFLGSGARYGLACEVNLKMKEMTLTHSEPFHFLEFRHGPIAMVNSKTLVVGLLSDTNREREAAMLEDVRRLEGNVLTLGEAGADVVFGSRLPEEIRNVLYLPVLQLMAFYRATAKGLNPDRPNNLEAVVKLVWQ